MDKGQRIRCSKRALRLCLPVNVLVSRWVANNEPSRCDADPRKITSPMESLHDPRVQAFDHIVPDGESDLRLPCRVI
jgi:hypothetical protein